MNQVDFIEEMGSIEQRIKLGMALVELKKLPDFNLLVQEYTEKEAIKLTKMLGTLEKNSANTDNLCRRLEAIGLFNTFLDFIYKDLEIALEDKTTLEQTGVNEDD